MNTRGTKKPAILNLNVQSPTMYSGQSAAPVGANNAINELRDLLLQRFSELEERLLGKIGELSAELSNMRTNMSEVIKRLAKVEKAVDVVTPEIDSLRTRVMFMENQAVCADVIMHGVPSNFDIDAMVKSAFDKLEIGSVNVREAFRIAKGNNSKKDTRGQHDKTVVCPPIIEKLNSGQDRVKFFRSLAAFRKKHGRPLCLSDVGLKGDGLIGIYECLTAENRKILQNAMRMKNEKRLHSVFSLRGVVNVRRAEGDDAKAVNNLVDLVNIAGGNL